MTLRDAGAIVTGGAGGLGAAVVRRLAAAGAVVGIVDIAEERAWPLLEEVGDAGIFFAADSSDERELQAALDGVAERAPVRVAVSCHGGPHSRGRTLDRENRPLDLDVFSRAIAAYLIGTFNVVRLAAAAMTGNEPNEHGERGVVVNTSSIAAFEGQIGQVSYAAAKGGINSMTLVAARDLASVGVRVTTIAPGLFLTPAYGLTNEEAAVQWGPLVPFPKRMGNPDEFAALVEHICVNPYVNGEVIRLDGAVRFPPKTP